MALVALQVVQAMQGVRGFKAHVPAPAPILREVIPEEAPEPVAMALCATAVLLLMEEAVRPEAVRAVLLRAPLAVRARVLVRVVLAEEAPEATEAIQHPGLMVNRVLLITPIRALLEAHPEQAEEEEVVELPHGSMARGVAVAVAVAAEVLREIRVTREIRAVQLIPQHTIAFQLLAAHPTQ